MVKPPKIRLAPQVADFPAALAPEPKRRLRAAIKGLAGGKGDIKLLEGKLSGFCRLRSGRIRVIYHIRTVAGEHQILCIFADYRTTVYDVLEQLLTADLLDQFSS